MWFTNAVNKVRMHIITVSLFKFKHLIILKKDLLTELEKKKDSHKDNNFFGVGPVLDG